MFFLMLLALASQRVEYMAISLLCFIFPDIEILSKTKYNWEKFDRGSLPHPVELLVILWVNGYIWVEIKAIWKSGLIEYMKDLWNLADLFCIGAFMNWIGLRALAFLIVQKEQWDGKDPDLIWKPREEWDTFEPMLLADAMFGAGMIASYLKVVHIFSINPHLGPLQIAIGKMIIDIIKFLFLYILVVFAFACGMNQLMWYYADLERQQCYQLPGGQPDFDNEPDSCTAWRRFANLWETSQSLFWASFGLVELGDFDLKGIGGFTRFWGLLMFGSYSVCNIIVLLNMLIAMMSNSYQIIFMRSDTEWKFSRSKLWISNFDNGCTVPVPFNLIPSPKGIFKLICCRKNEGKVFTDTEKKEAETRYSNVMKYIIRRYITNEQRKSEDFTITEDDINEVRQDINSFKFELLDILKKNNWVVPNQKRGGGVLGRKSKNMERQIQKGFQITKIDGIMEAFFGNSLDMKTSKPKDLFKMIAKAAAKKSANNDWRTTESIKRSSIKRDQIGNTKNSIKRQQNSLKRSLMKRSASQSEIKVMLTRLNSEELVAFNPHLTDVTPATRRAYAIFKSALIKEEDESHEKEATADPVKRNQKNAMVARDSIKKLVIKKQASIDEKPPSSKEVTAHETAEKLENVLDEDKSESGEKVIKDLTPCESTNEKPSSCEINEESEQSVQGIDNKAFEADTELDKKEELIVRVIPPTVHNTLEREEGSPTPSIKSDKMQDTRSSPSAKTKSGAAPSQPKGSEQISVSPTPSAKSEKILKPDKSPSASQKSAPSAEEYQFDPEGKSAVSGQKRTGWL